MQQLSRGLDLVTLFVARGLPAASRAVLILQLANHMEKTAFGRVAAAFVLVETLRVAYDFGQDTISIRFLARPGRMWHRSLHAAIRIKLCTWLTGLAIDLTLLAVVMASVDGGTSAAIALIGLSQIFWNLPINLLQARGWLHQSRMGLWVVCAGLPVSVGVVAALMPGYQAVRIYALLEYAALAVMGWIAFRAGIAHNEHLGEGRRLRRRQLLVYLRRGWNVCMGQLAALAYGKFDVLLVARFSAAAQVADYLFAQRFFELCNFVVGGASSVMYASITRKAGRVVPSEAWLVAAKHWARVFAVLAAGVGLSFWLAGPLLIRAAFPRMSGSIGILSLFGGVAFLTVANQYVTALLNSLGGYTVVARVALLNLAIIVLAGSGAFYWFGVTGLLLTMAAVYFISPLVQALALRQLLLQPRIALAN